MLVILQYSKIMIQKPLFKGDEQRGYVKRYFPQKWQYVFGRYFWFQLGTYYWIQIDRDCNMKLRGYHGKWFTQQDR
ncbi:hypothetical protein [Lentibacillus sp. CBA3610]|uniref:hypothetical protein n=1 Tax=Lentibacillus sp. CBA3610 TaxID=2518176 RepID=UPI001594F2E8|nr:hypothetical protein [Lentibacillus sp. CBA3610]QKY68812.1 hypothetical protein Len3610_03530 [Lentibacillus sp. CBA3610]